MDSKSFDEQLSLTKKISKEMLVNMHYAKEYDAASTVQWLIQRLKLVKSLIMNNESVVVEAEPEIHLYALKDFEIWVRNSFDDFVADKVIE